METNEALKSALLHEAEKALEELLIQTQSLEEGELQELEQQILSAMLTLGRTCLEQVVNEQAKQMGSPARRKGKCGHRQRLVSPRPKQVLTLMGPITIHRAY